MCVALAVQCGRRCFCNASDRELENRLGVTQVILGLQALEFFMFRRGDAETSLIEHVGQCGDLSPLVSAPLCPLTDHRVPEDDILRALTNPLVCVALALVLLDQALYALTRPGVFL